MRLFGYIKPKIPELKVREYERYKSVYCSLCKQLGKEYGILSRLALSYDSAFFALISLSLKENCTPVQKGKCVCNPLKKCNFCTQSNGEFSLASALTVMLTHQKLRDDIADSGILGKLRAYVLLPPVWRANQKASKRYPQLQQIISKTQSAQQQVEQQAPAGIDAAAEPTAQMLGQIFAQLAPKCKATARILHNLGYFLGKWVYMIDAADDIEKDIKEQTFNPFVASFSLTKESPAEEIAQAKTQCNQSLNAVLSQVIASYHLIEPHHFKPIIENIITEGLPQMQKEILFQKENQNDRSI